MKVCKRGEAVKNFLWFILLALMIWITGAKLTREVDELSEHTGVGRGFLGMFLLGLITSLPELFSTTTAGIIGNSNLAIGNIYGSNIFNLSMLIWADVFYRNNNNSLSYSISQKTVISAVGAIFMISLLSGGLFLFLKGASFSLLGVPLVDWLVLVVYFMIVKYMWEEEKVASEESFVKPKITQILKIVLLSLIIIASGIAISFVCDRISAMRIGSKVLGGTLIGGLLLGMATSLPELSVSISAVRLGSVDMAVGNVFGSNMFNVIIVPLADLFVKGSILSSSYEHLFSFTIIVMMSSVFLMFSLTNQKKKIGPLSPASYVLLFLYLFWAFILYYLRS